MSHLDRCPIDLVPLRQRYFQDAREGQLHSLVSHLNRIAWYAERNDRTGAMPVMRESKFFIEWTAPAWPVEQQALLADAQLQLSIWGQGWGARLSPANIAVEAQRWSEVIERFRVLSLT